MTTQTKNKPAVTLTDGSLKACIWRNERDGKQARYNVTFSQTYKDSDGQYQDRHSFSGANLLKIAKLAERAYSEAQALQERERIEGWS